MKNGVYINNSKRLIVGISIIFFTVILIIGLSYAYFTQSKMSNMDSIVTVDINDSLGYSDDDSYMRAELIPTSEENMLKGYEREGELKCIDDNGYSICSIYQFTVTNNSDVSQKLKIDLLPIANSFQNLKFMLFDKTSNEKIISNKELIYLSEKEIDLIKNVTLNSNNSKTYELIFYILNNENSDQTMEDAGKSFGANIKISSITTGQYILEDFGDNGCWETELLEDGTYKLVEFYGINNDNSDNENYGKINEACSSYVTKDSEGYYSITIPSRYGGNNITTIGNELFSALKMELGTKIPTFNENYTKINNIIISEGITSIEDGDILGDDEIQKDISGAFFGLGKNIYNDSFKFDELIIQLPSTLTYIGNGAFALTPINNLVIPKNVEIIERNAFYLNQNLTSLIFEQSDDGLSQLKRIGDGAFAECDITADEENPLIIPYSVIKIGKDAFDNNVNLTRLYFDGSLTETSEENKLIIDSSAFSRSGLSYLTEDDPFILPARIQSIGRRAFDEISSIKYIHYNGSKTILDTFGENWYYNNVVLSITTSEDKIINSYN